MGICEGYLGKINSSIGISEECYGKSPIFREVLQENKIFPGGTG